jgi:hypothetical protein
MGEGRRFNKPASTERSGRVSPVFVRARPIGLLASLARKDQCGECDGIRMVGQGDRTIAFPAGSIGQSLVAGRWSLVAGRLACRISRIGDGRK